VPAAKEATLPDPKPHHRLELETTLGSLHLQVHPPLTAPWTVIFGPSGSGKSTLLRALCGLLPKANIKFARALPGGWDELNRNPPQNRNLAYAPQEPALFPTLTVRENVSFASRIRNDRSVEQIDHALDLFDLTALANRMPRDLSGGESQRVSLARAFAGPQTQLMLLDEPFTGIGRAQRNLLLPRMQETLAKRGVPVISVTHDVEEAFLLKAEIVRLEAGKVIAQGPAAEVLSCERAQMLQVLAD
jgi:molybdate transport system ATP-binding protein